MNLNELKLRYLRSAHQLILFEARGKLVDSCHSLVDTTSWIGQSVYDLFPVLGTLQEAIIALDQAARPLCLPAVEMAFDHRQGIYDFEIYMHPGKAQLRLWMIHDHTSLYTYIQEVQQERNILRMEKEDLLSGKYFDRRT